MQSFALSFEELGLRNGMTFQELIDNISTKIGRTASNNCTSQIVFYKLRQIMTTDFGIDRDKISRNALMADLFPKKTRKKMFKIITGKLNIELNYFIVSEWILFPCLAMLIYSLYLLFTYSYFGILLLLASSLILIVSQKVSRKIPMKTFAEFIDRITTDNLVKLQREEGTINPKEVIMTIIKIIDDLHGLDKLEIDPNKKIEFE